MPMEKKGHTHPNFFVNYFGLLQRYTKDIILPTQPDAFFPTDREIVDWYEKNKQSCAVF
jgi:hypothetical protein